MADNYLGNKMEDFYKSSGNKKIVRHHHLSIDSLLLKNRSIRGYKIDFVVDDVMLKKIVSVNTLIASAKNRQVLRFKLVTRDNGAENVLKNIKLGGMLPELQLPYKDTEPEAFIIVCNSVQESYLTNIDLGISLQSMLLKAVDMGLNGVIICAFNKEIIKQSFDLQFDPVAILAIGKSAETVKLTSINNSESRAYYRNDGIHYVPKLQLDDLLIK